MESAVSEGGRRLRAGGLLVVGGMSHFVGDEAMARQREGGREAGAALQALQGAVLGPAASVLADVLQERRLLLRGEAAHGTAKPGLGERGRSVS